MQGRCTTNARVGAESLFESLSESLSESVTLNLTRLRRWQGHYTTYARVGGEGGTWVHFNDDKVPAALSLLRRRVCARCMGNEASVRTMARTSRQPKRVSL